MAERADSTHNVSNPRDDVPVAELRRLFAYDPVAGRLVRDGIPCGWLHSTGYRYVKIGRTDYKEHRVIWAVVTGEWPRGQIDHRNTDRSDNHFENLRDVGGSENQWNKRGLNSNNTSGFRGVTVTSTGYQAEIKVRGQRHHLGRFATAEQASAAYEAARIRLRKN